jgi:hypothetical protein
VLCSCLSAAADTQAPNTGLPLSTGLSDTASRHCCHLLRLPRACHRSSSAGQRRRQAGCASVSRHHPAVCAAPQTGGQAGRVTHTSRNETAALSCVPPHSPPLLGRLCFGAPSPGSAWSVPAAASCVRRSSSSSSARWCSRMSSAFRRLQPPAAPKAHAWACRQAGTRRRRHACPPPSSRSLDLLDHVRG